MREPTFSGSTPFLLTKADTIAHLTSGQDAVAEFIDSGMWSWQISLTGVTTPVELTVDCFL